MQWLIDIAKAAMVDYLADNPRYVDRGDPATYDFDLGDLTADEFWHDLDLSGIVPTEAKAVLIRTLLTSEMSTDFIKFRENGNSDIYNVSSLYVQAGWVVKAGDMIVSLDNSRIIEYCISEDFAQWQFIYITIAGWFL